MCRFVYFFSENKIEIGERLVPVHNDGEGWSQYKTRMERALENVRQSEERFSSYPSRYNCHYLAATEISANEWCRAMKIHVWRDRRMPVRYYIYRASTLQSVHWFNAGLFMQGEIMADYVGRPEGDYDNIARRYWSSAHDNSTCETDEIEGLTDSPITIESRKYMELDTNGNYYEIAENNQS